MLSDNIWVTRKARINAEKRLHRKAFLSQMLMIVYSASLVFFSISNLVTQNKTYDMLSVYGAIAILLASITLASQRYTERSLAMRNCYIHLDDLCRKAKRAEQTNDTNLLLFCESEYSTTLKNIENHTDYDYLCLCHSLRNNTDTTLSDFKALDYASFIWAKFWRGLLTLICFLIPLIVWGIL